MGNKKIIIIFSTKRDSDIWSEHLEIFGIHSDVEESWENVYKKSSSYNLLITDMNHGFTARENEEKELFRGQPFGIFNIIKKVNIPILLLDTYPRGDVEEKLKAINASHVKYEHRIQLMKDLLPTIKEMLNK